MYTYLDIIMMCSVRLFSITTKAHFSQMWSEQQLLNWDIPFSMLHTVGTGTRTNSQNLASCPLTTPAGPGADGFFLRNSKGNMLKTSSLSKHRYQSSQSCFAACHLHRKPYGAVDACLLPQTSPLKTRDLANY